MSRLCAMAISIPSRILGVHESSASMIYILFRDEKTHEQSIYAISEVRVMGLSFCIIFRKIPPKWRDFSKQ